MLAATVRMASKAGASELSWKYYTPERSTRLYTLAEANGLLIPRYVDHPFGANQAMIKLTHCSQTDLDKAQAALSIVRGPAPPEQVPRPRPAVELRG